MDVDTWRGRQSDQHTAPACPLSPRPQRGPCAPWCPLTWELCTRPSSALQPRGQGGCTESCAPFPGHAAWRPASSLAQPQGPQPGFSPPGSITHGLSRWTVMSQRWAPTQHSALSVTAPQTPWRSRWGHWRDGQDHLQPPAVLGQHICQLKEHRVQGLSQSCQCQAQCHSHTGLLPESASTKKCLIFYFIS